jgi:TNF receptor-associated protein 1
MVAKPSSFLHRHSFSISKDPKKKPESYETKPTRLLSSKVKALVFQTKKGKGRLLVEPYITNMITRAAAAAAATRNGNGTSRRAVLQRVLLQRQQKGQGGSFLSTSSTSRRLVAAPFSSFVLPSLTTSIQHSPVSAPTSWKRWSSTEPATKVAEAAAASSSSSTDASSSSTASSQTAENVVETMEFQAETRQLLDIVTNSLYTEKDVFLRELVSNASDALEKLRHLQATTSSLLVNNTTDGGDDSSVPLEIRIDLDEVTSSITITDTGIGMTRDEMVRNLGTIARSGSKHFIQELKRNHAEHGNSPVAAAELDPARGIIGKFGVGFYSAFMVANKVQVSSRSALKEFEHESPKVWTSDGSGTFEITNLPETVRQDCGSKIQIFLKSEHWHTFMDEKRVADILKRYSNFVAFPIYLNGNRVNTIQAIWAKDPKTVSEEEYTAFYKFIATAVDSPLDTYHFRADAPLDVKALFFIPSFHSEKYGMARMDPGVSLYSRKILIESHSPDILPDWLRFVKGVVDSEDLPLAISREKAQDAALIKKLRQTLTRKFLAHLSTMMKKDRDTYINEFYKEYAFFLKEGICQDYEFQAQLCKLLFFETSKNAEREIISLDEYIGRMRPEQQDIYYLVAPTRDAALNSPYLEAFEKANVEVLILLTAIDDFVMANLEKYEGRKLVSVEKSDIDLSNLMPSDSTNSSGSSTDKKQDGNEDADETVAAAEKLYQADRELSAAEILDFCKWFRQTALGESKVASCTVTTRLTTSPAIVTDNESGAMRRLMRMVDTSNEMGGRDTMPLPRQHVEINPKHAVIVGIHDLMVKEPTLARVLAEQVFDNCLVAAGLLDDSRSMLPRLNDILLCVVNSAKKDEQSSSSDSESSDNEDESSSSSSSSDKNVPQSSTANETPAASNSEESEKKKDAP